MSTTLTDDEREDRQIAQLLTLWRALPIEDRAAGIEALTQVVQLSARVQRLRTEVAAAEQQAKRDDAAIRDAERELRALGRAVPTRRRKPS